MRISDWSSDVCSSDLELRNGAGARRRYLAADGDYARDDLRGGGQQPGRLLRLGGGAPRLQQWQSPRCDDRGQQRRGDEGPARRRAAQLQLGGPPDVGKVRRLRQGLLRIYYDVGGHGSAVAFIRPDRRRQGGQGRHSRRRGGDGVVGREVGEGQVWAIPISNATTMAIAAMRRSRATATRR